MVDRGLFLTKVSTENRKCEHTHTKGTAFYELLYFEQSRAKMVIIRKTTEAVIRP